MEYRLNQLEKEFAAENHHLVYSFLNKNRLDESEYYDIAVLAYLDAVRRYHTKKNLAEYKFSTIAWKAMNSAIRREQKKELNSNKSLNELLYQDRQYILADSLVQEDCFNEKLVYMELLNQIKACLTEKQKRTLCKRADGYNYSDMAREEGITKSGINSRLNRARKKIRIILIEGGKRYESFFSCCGK